MLLLRSHCVSFSPSIPSACPPSTIALGGPYPVIQAHEATHYSVGHKIGSVACARIHDWLAGYTALRQTLLPFVESAKGGQAFSSLVNASCSALPSACEELRGMAAGAGLPDERLLMVMTLRHELHALAGAAAPAATECTDVHTDGAFAHNEDGSLGLATTAFYSNSSVAGGPFVFAWRYPASLGGHAFGFNAHGLALTMNALTPDAVDTAGVGVYFLCYAALTQPSVDAVLALLAAAESAYGGSLNVAARVRPVLDGKRMGGGVNVEFGPGADSLAVSLMPSAPGAPATFHMNNNYLHLDIPFVSDPSSVHRLRRAEQLVRSVPATAANLTTLWRVLGDTADAQYPVYRSATAATATFDLATPGGALLVHEGGNPLDAATRAVRFPMAQMAEEPDEGAAGALPTCGWCEGGQCNPACAHVKDHFDVSITPLTGRRMPYWRPPSQAALGEADAQVEVGVIVHHGSARNGDDYLCSMYNGVVRRLAPARFLLVSPQVYVLSDGPSPTELYWDSRGQPDRDWAWGGNSSASLAASVSSFAVLDTIVGVMTDAALYPKLRAVLVAGHSAGGQIVMRYALASGVHETAAAALRYFPANPSSYTYLDAARPVSRAPWRCGAFCDNATLLAQNWTFAAPPPAVCPAYDAYGYGLAGHLPPYLASRGVEAMVDAFGRRDVTYLSGTSDVCDAPFMRAHGCTPGCAPDDGGLDTSCEAFAQGKCRMARAHAFAQYVHKFYAARGQPRLRHRIVPIAGVGHSGCAVFQSPEALDAMFPQ